MAEIETTLKVTGMDCDGCERSISNALASLEGVRETRASHSDGTVVVRYDDARIEISDIGRAIEDAGYEVAG